MLVFFPLTFYLAVVLMILGILYALGRFNSGMGIPMLAVLVTVLFWYFGDAAYNDYDAYVRFFGSEVVSRAWLQVCIFLVVFLLLSAMAPWKRQWRSTIYLLYARKGSYREPEFQRIIRICFYGCAAIWISCVAFAILLEPYRVFSFIFPFLGERFDPFARPQIGGGVSAFLSLAQHLYMLAGAGFGIVLAMSTNRRIRLLALFFCVSVWSLFILDRTRNAVIVVALPFVLAWIMLRLRYSLSQKLVVLAGVMLVVEVWFSFVMDVRSQHQSVSDTFFESGVSAVVGSEARHEGLNMLEELFWITRFMDTGKIKPNGGQRYFAEMVNIVPRAIWAGKPKIGVDYALARGQRLRNDGTVTATISTGLIGQGTVNFGQIFGPSAAAFLMFVWVRILASIDSSPSKIKLPLVFVGLVLTFNLGRDISLLILYPFLFGYFVFLFLESRYWRSARHSLQTPEVGSLRG